MEINQAFGEIRSMCNEIQDGDKQAIDAFIHLLKFLKYKLGPRYAKEVAPYLKSLTFDRSIGEVKSVPDLIATLEALPSAKLDLNLAFNNDTVNGQITRLIKSGALSSVISLNLRETHIDDFSMSNLLGSKDIINLTSLDMSETSFGDKDAYTIANTPNLASLKTLFLDANYISDEGCIALAESTYLRLTELDLYDCSIHTEGAKALAESGMMRTLEILDLSYNHITDEGAMALASGLNPDIYKRVDLRGNLLSYACAFRLYEESEGRILTQE